jgi:hypothetical protein
VLNVNGDKENSNEKKVEKNPAEEKAIAAGFVFPKAKQRGEEVMATPYSSPLSSCRR